jgi:L-erythrulose 1-phosphate isomerase
VSRQFIGVSTKAYLGYRETLHWLDGIRAQLADRPTLREHDIQPFVIPSSPLILSAVDALESTGCWVGAQNAHWHDGAVTGEIPPSLIGELGARLVEVGHAERRASFGETPSVVHKKVTAILDAGLSPLLCVGEAKRGRPSSAALYCVDQIRSAMFDQPDRLDSVLIAYEPRWAIGAAEPANSGYVNEVVRTMRHLVRSEFPIRPLGFVYGGSAKPGLLPSLPDVDGLFLGRFAHDPANFGAVCDEALDRVDLA